MHPDQATVILVHAARSEQVFRAFTDKAGTQIFDHDVQTRAHAFVAACVADAYDQAQVFPGPYAVAQYARTAVNMYRAHHTPALTQEIEDIITAITDTPDNSLSEPFALSLLGEAVEKDTAKRAMEEFRRAAEEGGTLEVLEKMTRDLRKRDTKVRTMSAVSILHGQEELESKPRILTGVDPVDQLIGGVTKGMLIGVLAPSGGGKTILNIHLGVEWCRKHRKCVIVTYEEPREDLIPRVQAVACNLDVKTFRESSFKDLPDRYQRGARMAERMLSDRLMVLDYTGERAASQVGLETLKASIAPMIPPDDEPPLLVLIDWLLPWMNRLAVLEGVREDNKRTFMQNFIDRLKEWKTGKNIVICLFHQLNPSTGTASPNNKPNWADAAEFKSFAWYCELCIAIGNRTPEGVAWMCSSKNRKGATEDRLVQMDGAGNRWLDAESRYMVGHNGRIVSKDAMEQEMRAAPERAREADDNYGY